MILVFGDVHLGVNSYSKLNDQGFYCAELDAIQSLECIYARSAQEDISAIICTGDFFHTNHPAVKLIDYAISFFNKMNALNKPFVIIPGNHDASTYSHALKFIRQLDVPNIHLVENSVAAMQLDGHLCYFVPYVQDADNSAKLDTFSKLFAQASDAPANSIIVSHATESEARIGSEAYLISKKVESFDITKQHLVVLGHIHRQQVYQKANGGTVVYAGSTTYSDLNDIGQSKGYALIDSTNAVTFEPITGIRKFVKYYVADAANMFNYFASLRLVANSVVFIEAPAEASLSKELCELFTSKNITFGRFITLDSEASSEELITNHNALNPSTIFQNYVDEETNNVQYRDKVREYGLKIIADVVNTK